MYDVFSIALPDGKVLKGDHWGAHNPSSCFLFITGMNEHASRYDDLMAYLAHAGVECYALDAFGQGENVSSPEEQEKWPKNAFALTVDALYLAAKKIKERHPLTLTLGGHSMGSFMVQSYLERYPGTVDRALLMGTNGPGQPYWLAKALAHLTVHERNWDAPSKFLANLAMGPYAKAIKNRKTDLDWLSYDEGNVASYIADPYCGHTDTKGFFREFFDGLDTLYKKKNLKRIDKNQPIFLMAGWEDPVGNMGKGPSKLAELYRKLGVKTVSALLYPHMRHEIHNEIGKQQVYADLLSFLLP